jgi:very-short-patch-repair endonuclease
MTIVCKQCKREFLTKDKRQKYCSKNCYHDFNTGSNNHFFYYRNSKEKIQKINKINSDNFRGEGNPFYGKKHSDNTIENIKEKNRIYRENNKEKIEQSNLDRLNLTKQKIIDIFNEYKNTHLNFQSIEEKYNVDKRVLKKYFIKHACTKEELEKICFNKKYKNSTSAGEETLYLLLCNQFGKEKIKRQFNLSFYYYDFLVDSKLIVEYDGYYWHQVLESNDFIKNELAKSNNYALYRVREDEKRKVDFLKEIKNIKEAINEIQAKAN